MKINVNPTGSRVVYCFKKKNIFSFKKNGPNDFLYGLDYLQKKIPAKAIFAEKYKSSQFILKYLEKIIASQSRAGIHFQAFLNNRRSIRDSDIIFCVEDGVSFGILFYKLFAATNNKTVVLIQGLHDRYMLYPSLRCNPFLKYFYNRLLNKADLILTLSEYERQLLVSSFKLNRKKTAVFTFGVDVNFWNDKTINKKNAPGFALTVGNDMHRDFSLLINNYILKIPLKIISTKLTELQIKNINNNILFEAHYLITNEKLRSLYAQSKFVIIPLKKSFATSGLSSILQAFAMKTPVLAAETYVLKKLFVNYKHVLYYDINNSNSFKQKLFRINEDQKLRNTLIKNAGYLIKTKYNSQKMGENITRIFKNI